MSKCSAAKRTCCAKWNCSKKNCCAPTTRVSMLTWLESALDMLFETNAALLDNFIPVNSNCDIDGCDGVADCNGWTGCDGLTRRSVLHFTRVTM